MKILDPRITECLDQLQRIAADLVRDVPGDAPVTAKSDANRILIAVCKLAVEIETT